MSSAIQRAICFPPSRLPGLERPHLPAETPSDRQVDIPRIVGNVCQVIRGVVEQVAEDRPQKLRLRMIVRAQPGEFFGGILEREDFRDARIDRALGATIRLLREVEHLDVLADFLEHARLGLLSERALGDERLEPRRRPVVAMPWVVGQRLVHGPDDVRQRIEADDVGGAIGRAFRTPDQPGRSARRPRRSPGRSARYAPSSPASRTHQRDWRRSWACPWRAPRPCRAW